MDDVVQRLPGYRHQVDRVVGRRIRETERPWKCRLVMLRGSLLEGGRVFAYETLSVSPGDTRIVGGTNAPAYSMAGPPVAGLSAAPMTTFATPPLLLISGGFARSALSVETAAGVAPGFPEMPQR